MSRPKRQADEKMPAMPTPGRVIDLQAHLRDQEREIEQLRAQRRIMLDYSDEAALIDEASASARREIETAIAELYIHVSYGLPTKRPDQPIPHVLAGLDNRLAVLITDQLRAQDAAMRLLAKYNIPHEPHDLKPFIQYVSSLIAGVQGALNYEPAQLLAFCAEHHGWRYAELAAIQKQLPRSPRPPGLLPHRRLILDTWRSLISENQNIGKNNAVQAMLSQWTINGQPRQDIGPIQRQAAVYLQKRKSNPGRLLRDLNRDERRAKA